MPAIVTIRHRGRLLELSQNGQPLPRLLEDNLRSALTYNYLEQNRPGDPGAYDPVTGHFRPTTVTRQFLYTIDGSGRFVCPFGYLGRLRRELPQQGYVVDYRDVNRPHLNPRRFETDWDAVYSRFTFRHPRQEDMLKAVAAAIRGDGCGLVVSPPGTGKTFLFETIPFLYPYARIHIVVDSCDVMERIYKRILQHTGTVGHIGDGHLRFERTTVVSAASLQRVDGADEGSNKGADIVLADEVHRLMAPTYSYYLAKYQRAALLGFTATDKGRFDGADAKMEALVGERIYHMAYPEAVALGLVLPIRVEWLPIRCENPCAGLKGVNKERRGLWRNDVRNATIAERLAQVPADEQRLILVDTVEHGAFLKKHLPDYELVYRQCDAGDYSRYLSWGLLNEQRDPYLNDYRRGQLREAFEERRLLKAIATNWDTGVDFTGLSVLVPAHGKASKIMAYQGPGRTSRLCEEIGKKAGLVIDCLDYFDPTFEKRGKNRYGHYAAHEWEQTLLGGGLFKTRRKAVGQ